MTKEYVTSWVLYICGKIIVTGDYVMRIKPNDVMIRYTGRTCWTDEGCPIWVYPCTSAEMKFTGNTLKIKVSNKNNYWDNYLGCIIDQSQRSYLLNKDGITELEIMVPDNDKGEHRVLFFKRQDACHEVTILEYEIGDGERLLPLTPLTGRRIEVYGDSVSAGEVSEAVDCVGMEDPVHNGGYSNSWYSYAWITARKLKAQIHDVAQGGMALMDGTGWFQEPDQIGMESAWEKVRYNPVFGSATSWDFSKYTPQVVIVAIGQNDNHPYDFMKNEYNGEMAVKWRKRYRDFLLKLRQTYPDAHIICCTTLLCHDCSWDKAIDDVVHDVDDKMITHYIFGRNGFATPGHLRIPEACEMATELTEYIESLGIYDIS